MHDFNASKPDKPTARLKISLLPENSNESKIFDLTHSRLTSSFKLLHALRDMLVSLKEATERPGSASRDVSPNVTAGSKRPLPREKGAGHAAPAAKRPALAAGGPSSDVVAVVGGGGSSNSAAAAAAGRPGSAAGGVGGVKRPPASGELTGAEQEMARKALQSNAELRKSYDELVLKEKILTPFDFWAPRRAAMYAASHEKGFASRALDKVEKEKAAEIIKAKQRLPVMRRQER